MKDRRETAHGTQYFYKGQWHYPSGLAKFACVTPVTIRRRLNNGWSVKEAVSIPSTNQQYILYHGNYYSWRSLSEEVGISRATIKYRMKAKNMTLEEAIDFGIPKRSDNPCKYGFDCFHCPLKDCAL